MQYYYCAPQSNPRYYVQYKHRGAITTQWFNFLDSAIRFAKGVDNARIVDYYTYTEVEY